MYEELRNLVAARLAAERLDHTLQGRHWARKPTCGLSILIGR